MLIYGMPKIEIQFMILLAICVRCRPYIRQLGMTDVLHRVSLAQILMVCYYMVAVQLHIVHK